MSDCRKSRRVLVIASAFPPAGGSGVQRTAKFVKYLPSFGWQPIVWTCDHKFNLPSDPTLLEDIPDDVEIHRHGVGWTGLTPTLMESVGRCANRRGWLGAAARRLDWRLRARHVRGTQPDGSEAWATASLRPVLELIAQHPVDAIYSTYSPASNHQLALRIHESTGLPWIADFRDLWTDDYRYRPATPTIRAADRRLEQEILETADVVLGVSANQTAILASHAPQLRKKFATITNGFDPEDFENYGGVGVSRARNDRFIMAHVGRFDRWRTPDLWFDGLAKFAAKLGNVRDRFELRIVGHIDKRTSARLDECGVPWIGVGEVSHPESIREMRCADALLLNVPDGPNSDSVIPGKLFEYLASGRPILVVGPEDGAAEVIVQNLRAGTTVNFDADDIGFAIDRMFSSWRQNDSFHSVSSTHLIRYSRVVLTQRLAALFDDLVRPPAMASGSFDASAELQFS